MKFIKVMILLAAVFSIAGMAFFQLFVLLISAVFAQHVYKHHSSRQGVLSPQLVVPKLSRVASTRSFISLPGLK